MKKKLIIFSVLMLISLCNQLHAQELSMNDPISIDIRNNALLPYFEALENGDVSTIKRYISNDMFRKNKVLLEKNKDYPEFLRNFYRGAKFHMNRAEKVNGNIMFDVVIEFPNGHQSRFKLPISKESGNWKVGEPKY